MQFWKGNMFNAFRQPAFQRIKIVTSCYDEFCIANRVVQKMPDECFEFGVFNVFSVFIQAIFKIIKDYQETKLVKYVYQSGGFNFKWFRLIKNLIKFRSSVHH